MADLKTDVQRLRADITTFNDFKTKVEAYIAAHQGDTVDTTDLEAALTELETGLTAAQADFPPPPAQG